MLVEFITGLILDGKLEQAKKELVATTQYPVVFGKPNPLNELQYRGLSEAILESELAS